MIYTKTVTSQSVDVQIVDDAGLPVTGLIYSSFPSLTYSLAGANADVSMTLASLASTTTAYASGGVVERGNGFYRLDVPNGAFANLGKVTIRGEASGKHLLCPVIEVVQFDLAGTALPTNFAATIINSDGTVQSDTRKALGTAITCSFNAGQQDVNVKTFSPAIIGAGTFDASGAVLASGRVMFSTGTTSPVTAGVWSLSSTPVLNNNWSWVGSGLRLWYDPSNTCWTISSATGSRGTAYFISSGDETGPWTPGGTATGTPFFSNEGFPSSSKNWKSLVIDSNGAIRSNLYSILGTILTETVGGYLAAGFKKFFNVSAPVHTVASVDQAGDTFTRVGANGSGLTAIGDTRVAHLDADVSSRSTFAGGAVASVTGSVGSVATTVNANVIQILGTTAAGDPYAIVNNGTYGNSQLLSAIQNVQNNTFIATSIPYELAIPGSGSVTLQIVVLFSDETGTAKNLDSGNPVATLVNDAGTDRSSRLGSWANPSTGKYTIGYTNSSSDPLEGLHWDVSGTINGKLRHTVGYTQIVATISSTFTSSDRTTLNSLASVAPAYQPAIDSSGRVLLQPSQPGVMIPTVTTVGTTTNLTNSPTNGDFTSAMKASLNAATPTAAAVTGNVGGNVTGSVGSVAGLNASLIDAAISSRAVPGAKMDLVDSPNSTSLSAMASSVWSSSVRTLSSFGSVASDTAASVWSTLISGITTANSIGESLLQFLTSYVAAPTALQNREEMDANSTKLAATATSTELAQTESVLIAALPTEPPSVSDIANALFSDGLANTLKVNPDHSINSASQQVPIMNYITVPAAVAVASQVASSITIVRGDTLRVRLPAIGNIALRTKLVVTAKESINDADDQAVFQIVEGAGLVRWNGSDLVTSSTASLNVHDSATGEVDLEIDASMTSKLIVQDLVWDIQVTFPTGIVSPVAGAVTVVADVTRAVV